MRNRFTRRFFIGGAVAAAASSQAAEADKNALPTRVLGRTGQRVPILALGCGNRLFMAYNTQDGALEALDLAIGLGIHYLDTAQIYGDGKSETLVGMATKSRRKDLFLSSKTAARTYDDVLARCDLSLKRLQTDHLDLLHIHGLGYDDDLQLIEKGGAVKALYKLRDEKKVRFIGVTSHTDPATLATALDRYDFDCTQMALNAGLQGRSPDGNGYWKKGGVNDYFGEPIAPAAHPGSSFEEVALTVAVRKNLGVIAMKVTGQEGLIGAGAGKSDAAALIRYALSLPVSLASVGMPKLTHIRENAELARRFQPMSKEEMGALSRRLAASNKAALDYHFNHEHEDV